MIHSDMMEVLRRDQIDLAIVYAGNPCQIGIVYTLGIPFIYVDMDGLTDETIVASRMPWSLSPTNTKLDDSMLPHLRFRAWRALELLKELLVQHGPSQVATRLSMRYSQLDDPITRLFAEDYDIAKRMKAQGRIFPNINTVIAKPDSILPNDNYRLRSKGWQLFI